MDNQQTSKVGRPRKPGGKDAQRQFRCSNQEWAEWERVARAVGLTRSAWMRATLNRAAKRAANRPINQAPN